MDITKNFQNKKIAIIGGGPIGLFLAIKLSKMGHSVELFEKGTWPRDKVCGQGIMPSGLQLLKSIGVKFETNEFSCQFNGIEYIDGNQIVSGLLPTPGRGIKREVLSEKLYSMALQQKNLKLFSQYEIQDPSILNQYAKIFACDGMNSPTRKFLQMEKKRKGPLRIGARVHYACPPWSKNVQIYWGDGVEAYITPISPSQVEVTYLWYQDKINKGAYLEKRLLHFFPQLENKLKGYKRINDFKAYGPFSAVSKKNSIGKLFFVGDAYQFLDGITGEGISLGLKTANILAENFEDYTLLVKLKIKILYFNYSLFVSLALILSRHKNFRKFIFKILKRFPNIFKLLLSLNDINPSGEIESENFLKQAS